ncbi:MAG: segregation/condensation protein A [Candidatus Hydrogenedentota bacterium]
MSQVQESMEEVENQTEPVVNEPTKTPTNADFIVDEATDEVLRLHLDEFEGPLEVLLYLIKSQEIDIFNIPILKITEQYMKFLELMEEQNLEVAGDYLVTAATLIQIKSKMLIPVEADEDDEEIDEGDPRMELVEKLIAYRMYRDVAARLKNLEEERSNWFMRNAKPNIKDLGPDPDAEYIDATLFDLTQAFKNVLRYLKEDVVHIVEEEESSVDEKVDYIQAVLEIQDSVEWLDLLKTCKGKVEIICTFLAILELCRMNLITLNQHSSYGDIRLFRKTPNNIESFNVA